jgi:hypothetical protein
MRFLPPVLSKSLGVMLMSVLLLTPIVAKAQAPPTAETPVPETTAPAPPPQLPPAPEAPAKFTAMDNPDDDGMKAILSWELSPQDNPALEREKNPVKGYKITRKGPEDAEWMMVTIQPAGITSYVDSHDLKDNTPYSYRIVALGEQEVESTAVEVDGVITTPQFFNTGRLNTLICIILYGAIVLTYIYRARKGHELFVRRIAGLDAVDEAIGRATEMGRPILYISGLSSIEDISTVAAITILGRVARKTAEYETPLLVPNYDALVMLVEQETVKQAYMEAGHPDAYSNDMVFYLTSSQFGYVAAVDGIMLREKPAVNFYMGYYYAEALILAETGAQTGAIQIAGTDSVTQLPFFITSCDYTIIGEELYAASAYLSKDPLQIGSLKAQDLAKLIIGLFMLAGVIASLFGWLGIANLFLAK